MNRKKPIRKYISPAELAKKYGVHEIDITNMIHSGEIPAVKIGSLFRIPAGFNFPKYAPIPEGSAAENTASKKVSEKPVNSDAVKASNYIQTVDFAKKYGFKVGTVTRWARMGKIPAVKIGMRYLIPADFRPHTKKNADKYISTREFAKRHGVSQEWVCIRIRSGDIPAIRVNGLHYGIPADFKLITSDKGDNN